MKEIVIEKRYPNKDSRFESIEVLKRLPFVTRIYRNLHPSYGTCFCCGLPWKVVNIHFPPSIDGSGYFTVCEHCWSHKSYDEIRKSVIQLYNEWNRNGDESPYRLQQMLDVFEEDWKQNRIKK